ncbi:MAG TPA: DMT family transporter [Nocardioides sp.]
MAVLLSLMAALSYGLADFCGGMASKRASAWGVALVASATGAVLVLAATLLLGGEPTAADLWWGAAAGIGNGFGTAFLYRGLSSGRMGVVAPVSGVGAAVIPVAVGVLLGERPDPLVWVGILLALPAIWLVARGPSGSPAAAPGGVVDGALAGLGFGFLFVALAQVGDDAGLLPLAVNQVVAGVVIVLIATALGQPWRPQRSALLGGAAAGALGAAATVCFLLATREGYLSIASVVTSLYPAFTVILAATLLREHVHRAQAVGLLLCAVAVTLVAAG